MTAVPGMLLSFDDPILGIVPNAILFQYNPNRVTRVFTAPARGEPSGTGAALSASQPAKEVYSMTLEFDATDGLEREGPLTLAFGVGPRLAALEMLMQPVGQSPLAALVGGLFGGGGTSIPASRVPLAIFAWGPTRLAPVRLDSLTINETGFDELLNPIHASAEVSFTVLRPREAENQGAFTSAAAVFYQAAREVKAVLSVPQTVEQA